MGRCEPRATELAEALTRALWEGTPLTVFEALAIRKTILATDADGLVDVLRHDHAAPGCAAREF